jgi:carbonic anhydrase
MSATDDLLHNNEAYAAGFDKGDLPTPPARKVAVIACMDARLDVHDILGLEIGEAHIIRNAGGVVTDDAIRSLAISQRLLGTEEVMLLHHTECGMLSFTDDQFREQIQQDTGIKPPWSPESFTDLDTDVRSSIGRIRTSPFLPHKDAVRGFVYDVKTGKLREVSAS